MELGLQGRAALVLGAGGGIGGGVVESLVREGVRVAAVDINEAALAELAGRVPGQVLPLVADLADHASLDRAVDAAVEAFGTVGILVNNTGGPPPTATAGVPAAEWDRHFHAMISSLFHVTDRLLPAMRSAGWGRILTSTSYGVVIPIPNLGISNALRPALHGWAKSLAGEVAPDGVTVNVVVPGRIATRRALEIDRRQAERDGVPVEQVSAASAATIPMGRYGTVAEYADVITFLASDRAGYVTGSVVRVDGGLIPSV